MSKIDKNLYSIEKKRQDLVNEINFLSMMKEDAIRELEICVSLKKYYLKKRYKDR